MSENTINPPKKYKVEDDEINLIHLTKTLWEGRKIIIKSVIIAGVVGLLIALFSPKEYTATTTMVPQTADAKSGLGGLSGLAAMAGFNLNTNGGSDLPPTLYPQILSSVPFQLELMEIPLQFEGIDHPVSLAEYYGEINSPSLLSLIKKYTLGLPIVIIKAIQPKEASGANGEELDDNNCIQLSEAQNAICDILNEQLVLEINEKEGYLILSGKLPEARTAAQLTLNAEMLLQKYITEFKIEKATTKKVFIERRLNEKKKEFEAAQEALAKFRDEHKNVTSALTRTKEERLMSEYNMLFSVYSELAKQLEQAQIQVKENTPIFTIIKPVSVPLEKSKPKRGLILFVWLFMGGIIGIGIVFRHEYLEKIKKRWERLNN